MSHSVQGQSDFCVLCGRKWRDVSGICDTCRDNLERDLEFEFQFPWDKKPEPGGEKKEVVAAAGPGGSPARSN